MVTRFESSQPGKAYLRNLARNNAASQPLEDSRFPYLLSVPTVLLPSSEAHPHPQPLKGLDLILSFVIVLQDIFISVSGLVFHSYFVSCDGFL